MSYRSINDREYLEAFGLRKTKKGKYKVKNQEKLDQAYERAWQNRDFEINKFWSRAAYFWGFLVLIFGAYFALDKSKNADLELYLLSVGVICAFAWTFVIRGSKRWQENWESHVDFLEDFVSGPLYKTVFNRGRFYSVSKINEILSWLICLVWSALFLEFLLERKYFKEIFETGKADVRITIAICIVLLFIYSIAYGYGRSKLDLRGDISRRERY